MKKSIRCIALIMAFLLVLTLFASCHGTKKMSGFVVPDEFDTSKEYELTFWAKNDSNKTQINIYKQTISDFEKLYPNIRVNLRLYSDYSVIYRDVITNISTNTTPNVCITYPDHIATYKTGDNVVVPLDSLIKDEKYGLNGSEIGFEAPTLEEIIPRYLEEGKIGGVHYALPFMRSTEACFVNKDFVEKLGYTLPKVLTWDFVWEVSEAAMRQDADGNFVINGQKVMIPFIYKSTDNMMITMLKQKNAPFSDENGGVLLFNGKTKELLNTISIHAKSRSFSTFKISSYPANYLNAGQCVFAVDSTAGATWMGSNAPLSDISEDKIIDFETAVYPVPQFDTENMQMISQGPSICIFNKEDSGEVLASWIFAQFLLTEKVQVDYSKTEGYVPVTTKTQNSAAYLDYLSRAGQDSNEFYDVKLKATRLLLENVDNTFTTAVFNGSASLREAAGQLVENVVKSERRKETVDDAYYEKLYKDIASLYRLDSLSVSRSDKRDFGALPVTAKVLLGSLSAAWVVILVYSAIKYYKKKQNC